MSKLRVHHGRVRVNPQCQTIVDDGRRHNVSFLLPTEYTKRWTVLRKRPTDAMCV